MVPDSILGSFSSHFLGKNNEPAQHHEQLDFCRYSLCFGYVPDPESDAISELFHVFVIVFFNALFWDPHFSDFCDFWCPLGALSGCFGLACWGHFSGLRKGGSPMNFGRATWWYLGSPGGPQRRHLAKAKWLSYLAKAKWLRTQKLLYKFLRILHALGQRPGEFSASFRQSRRSKG